jgi:hypothetical protein
MLFHVLFLLQAAQQPPKKPVRDVPDPGIIATDQRVTPAGVQSVFDGRVGRRVVASRCAGRSKQGTAVGLIDGWRWRYASIL